MLSKTGLSQLILVSRMSWLLMEGLAKESATAGKRTQFEGSWVVEIASSCPSPQWLGEPILSQAWYRIELFGQESFGL